MTDTANEWLVPWPCTWRGRKSCTSRAPQSLCWWWRQGASFFDLFLTFLLPYSSFFFLSFKFFLFHCLSPFLTPLFVSALHFGYSPSPTLSPNFPPFVFSSTIASPAFFYFTATFQYIIINLNVILTTTIADPYRSRWCDAPRHRISSACRSCR